MPSEKAQEKRVESWTMPVCEHGCMFRCGSLACSTQPHRWRAVAVVSESALRAAEAREAKLRRALERIRGFPCAHPDDPNEYRQMAYDLVRAQEIARAALAASEEA